MYNMHIRQEYPARPDQEANDEVERRAVALPPTEAALPNHRLPPSLAEDAARDRSNRLIVRSNPLV